MRSDVRIAHTRISAAAVSALCGIAYVLIAVAQWRALAAPSWDLGIFSQLAKAYSTASAPIVPIKGEGFNLLGDHFHPLLVLLGPLWWLWPSPLMLLVLQGLLSAVSAYPLTRLSVERLGHGVGIGLGLAYGLSWGLQFAVQTQFHEIAFAVPIMAFALVAYLRGNAIGAALWAGALVFVKEDLGITVAVFGAILALRSPRRPRLGWGLAAWGLAWTLLATAVILPALNPESAYDYTGNVASLSGLFVPIEKWITTAMLIGTAGVIGLRSPLVLLMLPTLAWRFAGSVEFYWDWRWHYSAILMPIAAAALLDAVSRRRREGDRGTHARGEPESAAPSGAMVAGGTRTDASEQRRDRGRIRAVAGIAVGISALTTLALWSTLPLGTLSRVGADSPRMPAALAAIDAVPEGARVETDLTLMARLVPHADVYWLGNENPVPDAVVIDADSHVWRNVDDPDAAQWASDRHGATFVSVFDGDGFQVALREGP